MSAYGNISKSIDDLFMEYVQSFAEILDEYELGTGASGLAVPLSLCISDYALGFTSFKQKKIIKNYQKRVYSSISQDSLYNITSSKKIFDNIVNNPNYINRTDISIDEIVSYPGQKHFSHLGLFTVLSILDYNNRPLNQYTHDGLVNAADSIVELSYLFYKKLMYASRNGGSLLGFNAHTSFSSVEPGNVSKGKLEKELMTEFKELAGVKYFPIEDAQEISKLMAAYTDGNPDYINLVMMSCVYTLEKYPRLYSGWDDIMIKYHKKGLFPNWNIEIVDEEESSDHKEINKLSVALNVGDKVRRKEDGSIGKIFNIFKDKVDIEITDGPLKGRVKTVVKDAILDLDDGLYELIGEDEYNNYINDFVNIGKPNPPASKVVNKRSISSEELDKEYDDVVADTKVEEDACDNEIRFCYKCGASLRNGAVFCEKCGTRIR